MKKKTKPFDVLLALMITFTTISVAVIMTLGFRPLYYMDIDVLDIVETSGYPEEEIRENYDAVIDYCMSWGGKELELPTLPMSEYGKIHFEEVRAIFNGFKVFAVLGIAVSAAGIWYAKKKNEYEYMKWTSSLSMDLPVVIAALVVVFWEKFFVIFHKIFFNNDYWIFDPVTDPVIKILPDRFFMHCAVMIIVIVAMESILFGQIYQRRAKKAELDEKKQQRRKYLK